MSQQMPSIFRVVFAWVDVPSQEMRSNLRAETDNATYKNMDQYRKS